MVKHSMPDSLLYREWFDKAADDELSAQVVVEEGAPSTACFLAQQLAEKYLKGLLVYFKKDFPKVHDLLELETRLLKDVDAIHTIHEDLQLLNRYYIETRYPGDYPEFTQRDSVEALEAALRVKQLVLECIK